MIVALVSFASVSDIVPVDTAWLYDCVAEKFAYALNESTPTEIRQTPLMKVQRPVAGDSPVP